MRLLESSCKENEELEVGRGLVQVLDLCSCREPQVCTSTKQSNVILFDKSRMQVLESFKQSDA